MSGVRSRVTLAVIIAIMFSTMLTTTGFSSPITTTERVLAYESDQVGSLANACGNGEEPFNVLCQNLFSQIQGDNNAANIIGLQTGGEITTEPPTDVDSDGVPDSSDNCVNVA